MTVSRTSRLSPLFVDALNRAQSNDLSDEDKLKIWDDPLMFHAKEIGGLLQLQEHLIHFLYGRKIEVTKLWGLVSDEKQYQAELLSQAWEKLIQTKEIELCGDIDNSIAALINASDNGIEPSIRLKKARILHFLSLAMLYQAAMANQRNDGYATSIHLTGAAMLFGMASGGVSDTASNSTAQLSIQMMGALAKIAKDPKQKVKQEVRECWDEWRKKPSQYKSKSAFARSMLEKFPPDKDEKGRTIGLESQRVIERWCKEWESVSSL